MGRTAVNSEPIETMLTVKTKSGRRVHFLRFHTLSLAALAILVLWIVLYRQSDPNRHAGAFYGNSIADWSGTLVLIVATKYFFEAGSGESRQPKGHWSRHPFFNFLRAHSLTIFLVLTGLVWLRLYQQVDPMSRWGQVVGNILSEWLQMLGLVLMTKRLVERGSKEGHKC